MADTPVHIGTDRQLFVDDFWIDEARGTTRVLHQPTREAPAIEPDPPWDLSPCAGRVHGRRWPLQGLVPHGQRP